MARAHIRTRRTKTRLRFDVRYRLERGPGAALIHGGSFYSLAKAEAACEQINSWIARGEDPESHLKQLRNVPAESEVYFARLGDLIKIGVSRNPTARARELNAELLVTFPGGLTEERHLHQRFKKDRVAGEWFNATPKLLATVDRLLLRREELDASRARVQDRLYPKKELA